MAEGGLNVENSFASPDAATMTRMGREAQAQQRAGGQASDNPKPHLKPDLE